jgi:glycerol uptake facilitator-like aquaporin
MAAAGKILPSEVIPYCAFQILGGLVALEMYKRWGM